MGRTGQRNLEKKSKTHTKGGKGQKTLPAPPSPHSKTPSSSSSKTVPAKSPRKQPQPVVEEEQRSKKKSTKTTSTQVQPSPKKQSKRPTREESSEDDDEDMDNDQSSEEVVANEKVTKKTKKAKGDGNGVVVKKKKASGPTAQAVAKAMLKEKERKAILRNKRGLGPRKSPTSIQKHLQSLDRTKRRQEFLSRPVCKGIEKPVRIFKNGKDKEAMLCRAGIVRGESDLMRALSKFADRDVKNVSKLLYAYLVCKVNGSTPDDAKKKIGKKGVSSPRIKGRQVSEALQAMNQPCLFASPH